MDVYRRLMIHQRNEKVPAMFIGDITVFDYILGFRMGLLDFDDVYPDYGSYMTTFGSPSVVYEASYGRGLTESLSIEMKEKLWTMIRTFPVYGVNFSNVLTVGNERLLQLWEFRYRPDYDMCTLSYEDYAALITSTESSIQEYLHGCNYHTMMNLSKEVNVDTLCCGDPHHPERYYKMTALYSQPYDRLDANADDACTVIKFRSVHPDGSVVTRSIDFDLNCYSNTERTSKLCLTQEL